MFSGAIETRLFYMAVVQIFEDGDLGHSELSLVLFRKINFNIKHSIYLKPVGCFLTKERKKPCH